MPEGHQVSLHLWRDRAKGAIVRSDERRESNFSPSGRERAKGAIVRSNERRRCAAEILPPVFCRSADADPRKRGMSDGNVQMVRDRANDELTKEVRR